MPHMVRSGVVDNDSGKTVDSGSGIGTGGIDIGSVLRQEMDTVSAKLF